MKTVLKVVGAGLDPDVAEVISLLRREWGRSSFEVFPNKKGDLIVRLFAPEQKEKVKWILSRYGFEVRERS